MVVVCPECGTKFTLDESRIPGATAKVRCSRCRHVFRITREGRIVAPPWKPPEAGSPQEEGPTAPSAAPPSEPGPEPDKQADLEEVPPARSAPAEAEFPAACAKRRPWLWLSALCLAAVVITILVWWVWQGGFFAERRPQPAPGPGAEVTTPPPTVVTPPALPVPAADLKDLSVDWAQARYQGLVNEKGGGQLLMIQGEVINNGKSARGPVRLKAILTDSQHQPLREETVYAGSIFTDEELRTLKPEAIKRWLAKPGGRSQVRVLKPSDKQPFTVLFFGVPDNLAETQSGFQIVVVEGAVIPD